MRFYVPITLFFFSAVICINLVALGPLSAQHPFENVVAADAIYQDFPPMKTLPPEELSVVLETWDAAVESNDLRAIDDVMQLVSRGVPRPYRLRGAHVLRYDNPELKERVIELYLSEIEGMSSLDPLRGSGADIAGGEMHQDYMDALVPLALYTFTPRIYDTVLRGFLPSGSQLTYLATVNPGNVLQLLLDAQLREPTTTYSATDFLDLPDGLGAFPIYRAFKLLSLLCDRSSEVVLEERQRVLDFIRTRVLHYVTPVEVSLRDEPVYRNVVDYRTRVLALKSLELLAESADVYSVVDNIVRNPPANPAAGPNEITREGVRLIEQIRALK